MENQKEQLDYTKYTFRPEESLDVKAGALSQIYKTVSGLVEKEGVGFNLMTDARYEYVHKETSEVAKPNTKRETLDKDYRKVFSPQKTIDAEPTIQVTETGKVLFSILTIIDTIRIENLDAGRGTLIEVLQAELQEKQKRMQEAVLKQQQEEQNSAAVEDIGLSPVAEETKEEAPKKRGRKPKVEATKS